MSGVKGRSGRKGSYAKQLSKALGVIDRELPNLIEKLIDRATNGDREALIYLIDRRLGKPVQQTDMNLQGGEELTAGLVAQLFAMLAAKRKELDSPVQLVQIEKSFSIVGKEGSGQPPNVPPEATG